MPRTADDKWARNPGGQRSQLWFKQLILHMPIIISMDLVFGKLYKLDRKLGQGAFGEIYHAININKPTLEFAVKLQSIKTNHPQLFYEAKLLSYLTSDDSNADRGLPQIYFSSTEGQYNVMVMDLLGPSLEDLFVACDRSFDLPTTVTIGLQILQRIEFVHSKKFLHRDIKPDNFLVGPPQKEYIIYLIDFGLAKKFIGKDGKHIPYRDNKMLTGTARYASLNTHIGIQQGRRDDIESLAYVLIYFMKGILPWQNLKANNKKQKYQRIMEKKLSITPDVLCKGLPKEFQAFLTTSRKYYFDEEPDYQYFRLLLNAIKEREGIDQVDFCFNSVLRQKQEKLKAILAARD